MRPTPITRKQFICWFIVFTIGVAFWASPLWGVASLILVFGNLILLSPQERSRPVPAREVLWTFAGVAVLAILMVASKRWLPADFGAPLARVLQHPALVAILWAFVSWLTWRRVNRTDAEYSAT
jgi:hypothetical protein